MRLRDMLQATSILSTTSVNSPGLMTYYYSIGFPSGSDRKESACNLGDPRSVPGSGRFPGVGNGNPLQYSCLENSKARGAWRSMG